MFEKIGLNKKSIYPEGKIDSNNINIVKPIVYPLAENFIMRSINSIIMKNILSKKLNKTRILWLTLPSAVDYIDVTDSDFIIYYCCDDFSDLAGVDHKVVPKKELELIEKADLVFTTSDELYQKFYSNKTFMLPHGVHDLFFNVQNSDIDIEKVNLGFYGSIDKRIDYNLIQDIIDKNKNITIEIVGHIDSQICSQIENMAFKNPRIKLSPALEHKDLINKINDWDILILPFLHNDYSKFCNPLKL